MTRSLKILAAVLALVAVVAAIFYYATFDPEVFPSFRCPIKTLTGYNCPGCGCQRALHALLNGHIRDAWQYNSFIFFAAPISLLYIIIEAYPQRFVRLNRLLVTPYAAIAILIAIILAFIVKN